MFGGCQQTVCTVLSRHGDDGDLWSTRWRFIYSPKPPQNPNLPKTAEQNALVKRGEAIFNDTDNRCATCHKKEYGYTNNKLTPARAFKVPDNHSFLEQPSHLFDYPKCGMRKGKKNSGE